MTTILATHDAIYSDSNVDFDGAVFSSDKIFRFRGKLVGCAGDSDMIEAFQNAMKAGRKPKVPPLIPGIDASDRSFNALVVDKDGQIWHYDSNFSGDVVREEFMGVGSGGSLARAAMKAGATPEDAIRIACEIDSGSRLPVQCLLLHPEKR